MMITNIINQESNGVACGNCGFPISHAALDYKLYKYFVVELSSFQLKGICKFAPKIAVITNINNAHLDYHESIDDYHKSKYKITMNQSTDDYLVLNLDDEKSMSLFSESKAIKIKYSLHNKMADCYINGKWFYFKNKKVCKLNSLKNKTDIMCYNALASICVGKLLNIKNANISNGLKSFTNIKYRLQEIKPKIYNDAKSTNVYSTISALKEFLDDDILLICGGYDRNDDIDVLGEYIKSVKCVYVYGMTKDKVKDFCNKYNINVFGFDTLKEAVIKALNDRKKEVILYSPMFASYDQYSSYEERGKEFNNLVNKFN